MDIGSIVVDLNIVEAEGLSGLRSSRDSGRNTSQNPTLGLGEDKGLAVVNGMYISCHSLTIFCLHDAMDRLEGYLYTS